MLIICLILYSYFCSLVIAGKNSKVSFFYCIRGRQHRLEALNTDYNSRYEK